MRWLDLAYAIPTAAGLVVLDALFAGTEVAVFSLRRVDREQMSRSGRPADKSVLALLAQPRRLITAVLIGVESIIASLVVVMLGIVAVAWPELTWSPWVWGGVALGVALPLVILLGEVLPKTLALKNPIGWSRVAAWPLATFAIAMSPVRWLVQGASAVLLRPLGDAARSRPSRDLSEEEFKSLIDAGSKEGQVDARERRLIHRVFDFADKNVGQIMTPRERMFALSYDLTMSRLAKEVAARGFSRVPIYQKSVDNIRGILNAKDLVRVSAGVATGRTLGELLHEPLFVPRTTPVKRLFITFKQKRVHMGIVVNEYGKVLGLVTMDDVLAQLFGALRDERDALQTAGKRPRSGRTPVPGVPIAMPTGPAFETGPVGRVDPSDLTPVPREGVEMTPPELTPPPVAVTAAMQALANKLATSRPITQAEDETTPVPAPPPTPHEPTPTPTPAETDDDAAAETAGEPARKTRATTKDEDDQDESVRDRHDHDDRDEQGGHGGGAASAASPGGTPVPITDSDTGPSGPVSLPGRGR